MAGSERAGTGRRGHGAAEAVAHEATPDAKICPYAWNGGASTGPAADGRIKPDLSNYYDAVRTTSSTSNTSYTTAFSGTSAAAPITCGHAGLLFQMWADGTFEGGPGLDRDVFASRPRAATAKALLIDTADQHPFTGETHDLTRTHQGWGTASVGHLLTHAQAGDWHLPILVDETDLLQMGQTATYTLPTDGHQPLRATMVYTDPMASPTAAQARVNDLTLKLTARTIQVIADQINADGHVETPEADADFALVVTGT